MSGVLRLLQLPVLLTPAPRAIAAVVLLAVTAGIRDAGRAGATTAGAAAIEAQRIIVGSAGRELNGWAFTAAPGGDGGLAVAWLELEPGWQHHIVPGEVRLQRFDARLKPLGPAVTIGESSGCRGRPALATSGDSQAAVLWCASPAGQLRLRWYRDGVVVGRERRVDEVTAGAREAMGLCWCGDRLLAAWTTRQPAEVQAQLFDLEGVPIGAAVKLDRAHEPEGSHPAAACDGRHFVVVWGDGHAIWAQALSRDGVPAGPRLRLDDGRPGTRLQPYLAMGPRGEVMFSWFEIAPDGTTVAVARRFHTDGGAAGRPFPVSSFTDPVLAPALALRMAFGAHDRLLFVWQGSDRSHPGLSGFGRWFDVRRELPIEEEFSLGDATTGPWVVPQPSGAFLVVWSDPPIVGSHVPTALWSRPLGFGLLASAPEAPAEVQCAGERLGEMTRHLRPLAARTSVALLPRTGQRWSAMVREPTGAPEPAAAQELAGRPGPLPSPSWYTVDAQHRITAEEPGALVRATPWSRDDGAESSASRGISLPRGPGAAPLPPSGAGSGRQGGDLGYEGEIVRDDGAPGPAQAQAPPPGGTAVGQAEPTCEPVAVSPWDEARSAWLVEHLRPLGGAPSTYLTVYRGGGVDTFEADLFPSVSGPPPADSHGAATATGASTVSRSTGARPAEPSPKTAWISPLHLAVEIRVFCSLTGAPVKLRLRLLPPCSPAIAGGRCSSWRGVYGLGWESGHRPPQETVPAVWSGRSGRNEVLVDLGNGGERGAPELSEICGQPIP